MASVPSLAASARRTASHDQADEAKQADDPTWTTRRADLYPGQFIKLLCRVWAPVALLLSHSQIMLAYLNAFRKLVTWLGCSAQDIPLNSRYTCSGEGK